MFATEDAGYTLHSLICLVLSSHTDIERPRFNDRYGVGCCVIVNIRETYTLTVTRGSFRVDDSRH